MILSFISDDKLIMATKRVLDKILSARNKTDEAVFKNAVDPFSGLFDIAIQGIDLQEWLSQEKSRQIQKTFQNAIGEFHQEIIGSLVGWENLNTGNLMDVRNKEKKIVAEIKNKYNTTKGNHRTAVYDDLKTTLSQKDHENFTGYLVEILPKNRGSYNKEFTPSDNAKHKRRPKNKKIRVISGQLFYDLASGEKETLKRLYKALPQVIEKITSKPINVGKSGNSFEYLFEKAY